MSFWQSFSWGSVSSLEALLEKETTELKELLDEEELLSELKAQNKKLIDYLSKDEVLHSLMQMTLSPVDMSVGNKYQYLSTEVICCDNPTINEKLFQNKALWELLFNFIYQPAPLPSITSSYFEKVGSFMISKNSDNIIKFLKSKHNYVSELLKHTNNTIIMDFLTHLFNSIDLTDDENLISDWFKEIEIISSLVECFDRRNDENTHENVSRFLTNLITHSALLNSRSLPLYHTLDEEKTIRVIVNHLLADHQHEEKKTTLIFGVNVLIELVKRNSSDVYSSTPIHSLPPILQIILENLENFISLLISSNEDEIFGMERMTIIDLVVSFISTRYVCLLSRSLEFNLLSRCFDLFFKYEWNNLLHIAIQHIATIFIESNDEQILSFLFNTMKLHEVLATAGNKEIEGTANKRKGYMGVVAVLATAIENVASSNSALQSSLDDSAVWKQYSDGDLFEMRKKEKILLGGVVASDRQVEASAAGDEDEDKALDIGGLHTAIKTGFEKGLPADFSVKDFEDEENLFGFCYDDIEQVLSVS